VTAQALEYTIGKREILPHSVHAFTFASLPIVCSTSENSIERIRSLDLIAFRHDTSGRKQPAGPIRNKEGTLYRGREREVELGGAARTRHKLDKESKHNERSRMLYTPVRMPL
jgi:hypothetical protein